MTGPLMKLLALGAEVTLDELSSDRPAYQKVRVRVFYAKNVRVDQRVLVSKLDEFWNSVVALVEARLAVSALGRGEIKVEDEE